MSIDISALGQHATASQLSTVAEHSNWLQQKIASWQEIQILYMPRAAIEQAKEDHANLDGTVGLKAHTILSLSLYEWKLRKGQAYDALHDIWHYLRFRSHLFKHKDRFVRGVCHNTRANATISKVQAKINLAMLKYRTARQVALRRELRCVPNENWQQSLRVLADDDIHSLSDGLMGDSEGRHIVSWIWRTHGMCMEDDAASDEGKCFTFLCYEQIFTVLVALRIEWCRSQARASRWIEEVELLQEEMHCILAFLTWQGQWRETQCNRVEPDVPAEAADGLRAYAQHQAAVRHTLYCCFQFAWRHVEDFIKMADVSLLS